MRCAFDVRVYGEGRYGKMLSAKLVIWILSCQRARATATTGIGFAGSDSPSSIRDSHQNAEEDRQITTWWMIEQMLPRQPHPTPTDSMHTTIIVQVQFQFHSESAANAATVGAKCGQKLGSNLSEL